MERLYIKVITKCVQCPHYCDEGEFCHHPDRGHPQVVYDYPIPDNCQLPQLDVNKTTNLSDKLV
jgi:Pyruvate/2-oxoacid:ferredoxin oxidoreductase delta subunit